MPAAVCDRTRQTVANCTNRARPLTQEDKRLAITVQLYHPKNIVRRPQPAIVLNRRSMHGLRRGTPFELRRKRRGEKLTFDQFFSFPAYLLEVCSMDKVQENNVWLPKLKD
jgi:hypothetical protein